MDLDQQLQWFDANAQLAFERCLQEMVDDRPAIIAEARRRLIAGYPIYGMTGWLWKRLRLRKERREEWGDGLNYYIMEMWSENDPLGAARWFAAVKS